MKRNWFGSAVLVLAVASATALPMTAMAAPKCKAIMARTQAQLELYEPEKASYAAQWSPITIAGMLVTGGMGRDRARMEATMPGMHDWAVLAVLKSWEEKVPANKFYLWSVPRCLAEAYDAQ